MKLSFEHITNNEIHYNLEYNNELYTVKQDRDRLWQRVTPVDDIVWFNEIRPWLLTNPTPRID